MQQWFNLSDPMMEDALHEIESMRRFAGLELCEDRRPDETTILKFRHLLERQRLTDRLFAAVSEHLQAQGLQLSKGAMVDATLIAASPSTKNAEEACDPRMHQTRKGNQWHFGMKVHVGADVNSGTAHTVTVTAANEADISQLLALLRASDEVIFGDAGYASDSYKRGARVGSAVEGQRQAQTRARKPQCQAVQAESATVKDPRSGGAPVPHHQVPIWVPEGAIPGPGEESGRGHGPDGDGQSVPATPGAGGMMAPENRLQGGKSGGNTEWRVN